MDDSDRIVRDALACQLANNNTPPLQEPYCEGTFDLWACWPPTPANSIARAPCPAFVPGFDSELWAHKVCQGDGTWWVHPESNKTWSNYTTCVKPDDDVSSIIVLYETGYSISLIALVAALAVLITFRSLRCSRVTLHMNLFASFALNNALWLAWFEAVVRSPPVLNANPLWCRALQATTSYAMLSTYTWMLMEGIYLHTVLVWAFVSERKLVRILVPLGWLLPAPSAIYGAWARYSEGEGLCWIKDEPRAELVLVAGAALLINAVFLCNIVRVLCGKLRAAPAGAQARATAGTALQAFRATCLLAPLLGVQFLLTPFKPQRAARGWMAYEAAAAVATTLQGLAVALLYCFLTADVRALLRRRFRPRADSATATAFSLVRSTPHAEDKL